MIQNVSVSPADDAARRAAENRQREVLDRLRAAREAQLAWADWPVRKRCRVVRRLRYLLVDHAEDLARLVTGAEGERQSAKSLAMALAAEVVSTVDACRFLERSAASVLRPRKLGRGGRPAWLTGVQLEIRREPLGVTLVVGPANYPLFLPAVQALQSLVAGNAVLMKPAPGWSAPMHRLGDLLAIAGLPTGLFSVLPESVEAVALAMPSVNKVFFTGSTSTGREVLAEAAEHIVPVTAELSGCDAFWVSADADLGLAVKALAYGMQLNAGATCIAPKRVFVAASVAEAFERRLVKSLSGSGSYRLSEPVVGQLREVIADALRCGARLLTPGLSRNGPIHPLVLTGVTSRMRVMREDVPGPIVGIHCFASESEALTTLRECPYALGLSVFASERRARQIADAAPVGVVVVNDIIVPTADPRLPFGGRGQSGFGVTRGAEGLLEHTAIKAVSIRRGRSRPHLEPEASGLAELLVGYLRVAHGRPNGKRWSAIAQFGRGIWQVAKNSRGRSTCQDAQADSASKTG